jgi:hypothetical protein
MNKTLQSPEEWRVKRLVSILAATFLTTGSAAAFEINTGNPDVTVRWDNTVRYNAGWRMQGRDPKIANYYAADEGDALFDKGDAVTNRLDLLSEFDFVYKRNFGFRVSGAGWYDGAYGSRSSSNSSAPPPAIAGNAALNSFGGAGNPGPSYTNNQYTSYTKRYYRGQSGELLDAFVFANFDAGNTPVKLKAGRHTVFWGESLLLGGALHGISYGQMPLDIQKGQATPGAEAKELFRPLNQLSAQSQVTDALSIAAQYFLQWEASRFPEGGTYLGPVDFAFNGPQQVTVGTLPTGLPGPFAALRGAPIGYSNGGAIKPKDAGEFGLAARWSPEFLVGTLGFYYRRYTDKIPQVLATRVTGFPAPLAALPNVTASQYNLVYGKDVDLFGISLAKNIGGVSLGAELSYRHDTPLSSSLFGFNQKPGAAVGVGTGEGPRGNTIHGVLNLLGTIGKTPLFNIASWSAEVTWSNLQKVLNHPELFQGVGYGGCAFGLAGKAQGDKWDGCATRNYVGLGGSFTPTWYQVAPGVDLSMPITYAAGVKGNAATTFGGNQGLGNYSVGLGADIDQKYRVDLKYIAYFGRYRDNGTSVTTLNGLNTLIADRDFLSLTLKTTF